MPGERYRQAEVRKDVRGDPSGKNDASVEINAALSHLTSRASDIDNSTTQSASFYPDSRPLDSDSVICQLGVRDPSSA